MTGIPYQSAVTQFFIGMQCHSAPQSSVAKIKCSRLTIKVINVTGGL